MKRKQLVEPKPLSQGPGMGDQAVHRPPGTTVGD